MSKIDQAQQKNSSMESIALLMLPHVLGKVRKFHLCMHTIYCLKICDVISVLGMDCRLFPDSVHDNAICGDSNVTVNAKKSKGFSAYESTCKPEFIGNGYSCIKKPKDCEDVCCNSIKKSLGIEETYCGCSNYACLVTTTTGDIFS